MTMTKDQKPCQLQWRDRHRLICGVRPQATDRGPPSSEAGARPASEGMVAIEREQLVDEGPVHGAGRAVINSGIHVPGPGLCSCGMAESPQAKLALDCGRRRVLLLHLPEQG